MFRVKIHLFTKRIKNDDSINLRISDFITSIH